MPYLSLILFLPVFLILGSLFLLFPRVPSSARRNVFNAVALTLALALSVAAIRWGYLNAEPAAGGAIWRQVLATLLAYGVFLASLVAAFLLRLVVLRPARH